MEACLCSLMLQRILPALFRPLALHWNMAPRTPVQRDMDCNHRLSDSSLLRQGEIHLLVQNEFFPTKSVGNVRFHVVFGMTFGLKP